MQAIWDDKNAAELCSTVLRSPNPPILDERRAKVHSLSENEQHRNDSSQSRTALSELCRAALCFLCGTTRREYSSFPKAAHCLSKVRATWGSGNSPRAVRTSTALSTLSWVWLLQKSSEPMGPPSSSKFPLSLKVLSNVAWFPAVGITSHLVVLNWRPIC